MKQKERLKEIRGDVNVLTPDCNADPADAAARPERWPREMSLIANGAGRSAGGPNLRHPMIPSSIREAVLREHSGGHLLCLPADQPGCRRRGLREAGSGDRLVVAMGG